MENLLLLIPLAVLVFGSLYLARCAKAKRSR